ncbi:MAG: hypothetical protein WC588_02990 [Candidatus Micrarchaeia archaeon]
MSGISTSAIRQTEALRAAQLASGISRAIRRNEIATFIGNIAPYTGSTRTVRPVSISRRKALGRTLSVFRYSPGKARTSQVRQ